MISGSSLRIIDLPKLMLQTVRMVVDKYKRQGGLDPELVERRIAEVKEA